MQKNRTTYPTGRQAVANDGLLAGRELESDAELIALGWLKPTNLFEGDELPAIYPEDDAQERADLLSARHAERDAKRHAERDAWVASFPEDRTAFELAIDTGRIGGADTLIQENVGYSLIPVLSIRTQPTFFAKPTRPRALYCLASGANWGATLLPDGSGKVIHLDCLKCPNCRDWRRRKIAIRYGLGKAETQTLIRVSGFASDDYTLPVAFAESLRRRAGGNRLRLLRRGDDYFPELVIVYDRELEDATLALVRADLDRKGLHGSIAVGPVSSDDVYALTDPEPTRQGTRRQSEYDPKRPWLPGTVDRETTHFTGWPDFEQPEHDYLYGDVDVTTDDPNPPDATPPDPMEKSLLRMPLIERSIVAVELRMEGQTINRGLFDQLVLALADGEGPAATEVMSAIHQTTGPVVSRQLLTDVAAYLANPYTDANPKGVRWRDCWRPVLDAVGLQSPSPHCLQCGEETPSLTTLYLCVKCELRRYGT